MKIKLTVVPYRNIWARKFNDDSLVPKTIEVNPFEYTETKKNLRIFTKFRIFY